VRQRHRLIQDQTRCANRIKHLLLSNGIQTGEKSERWSLRFISKLQQLECRSGLLKTSLQFALEQYLQIRRILKEITLMIREVSRQEPFAKVQAILQSIDGVGPITGMVIQSEIGDINRFKRLDSLCDYAGFVPDIYSSNDKTVVRGISKRGNEFLREAIIESSWMLIRRDPAMLMKYQEYKSRMNANKAIVRIAKHLLSRIRFLWKNDQTYVRGIV
jgi:transposase